MGFYSEKFLRNLGTVTKQEQSKLKKSRIAVIGLGGTGGIAFEMLVRAGIGNFAICDHDAFDLTNFNRQILSDDGSLDKRKIDVAEKKAKEINNEVRVVKSDFFEDELLEGCNAVVDCTDNVRSRILISKSAKSMGIPYVFCSAGHSRGMVSVFIKKDFTSVFGKSEKQFKQCSSVISPVPAIAGSLASAQIINLIIGKQFIRAPVFLFFDLFSKVPFWTRRV
ncbi:MAG: ThiF family adenylyltransferase [Candidatus Micrarchaeota archaeon]